MKMRETKRRKRLLSLFTTVILITSSAWTSFAYAEGEDTIQDVQNEIVQELSSEPQLIPVEETEEIIPQEDVEQDVGEEQIVEEEQVVEEEQLVEEEQVVEEEAVTEQAPAMAAMMVSKPPAPKKEKEITVEKIWKDQDGKIVKNYYMYENFPDGVKDLPQVTVGIFDGKTRVGTITLKKANQWKYTFKKLDGSKNYTLKEDPIKDLPAGYILDSENSREFTGGCDNDMPQKSGYKPGDIVKCSYELINKLVPVRDIEVTKVWKDEHGQIITDTDELPEVSVKIDFTDETVEDITLKLNEDNDWTDKANNILESLKYEIKEEAVTGLPEGFEIKNIDIHPEMEKTRCIEKDIKCMWTVTNTIGEEDEFEGRIRGFKFNDLDKDGLRDENEPGLEGVTIYLYNVNPSEEEVQPAATAVTDENGAFSFAVAAAGTYYMKEKLPEGWVQSAPANNLFMVTLTEEDYLYPEDFEGATAYLFGNYKPDIEGRIRGFKFNDLDMDGFRDENEPGLEGVTIYLYNVNPSEEAVQPADTAVTDENGAFSFTVAAAGTYYMKEKLPEGWVQSLPLTNLVSVAITEEDYMYPEHFEGATAYMFGNYQPDLADATIEGYKFNDSDRDGVWDEVESGLQGWTITLWKYLGDMDESGTLTAADVQNMKTAVTDANGYYKFTELEDEATYYISENIGSMPYWYQTYPVTGPSLAGTGRMHVIVEVEDGDVFKDVNFGNYYFRPDDGGGDDDDDDGDDGGTTGGGGGGGTTVRITPGGGTEEPIVIEAFGPEEEVIVSLPVFSAEEPEEVVLAQTVMSADPDENPQTSDAGIAIQMQMLGLSLAAMYVLKRKI